MPIMRGQEQLRDVRCLADHVAAGFLADARGQRPPVAGALEIAPLVDRRGRCFGRLVDGAELLATRLRGVDQLGLESEPLHRQMQQRFEVELPFREHYLLLQHELADRFQELLRLAQKGPGSSTFRRNRASCSSRACLPPVSRSSGCS